MVLYSLKNNTFKKLNFKKRDVIQLFNDTPLSSQKDLLKKISLIKKGKKFSIELKRKKINYLLSYQVVSKNKYKLLKKTFKRSKKTSSPSKKTSFPSKKTFKRSKKTSSPSKKTFKQSKKTSFPSKKTFKRSKKTPFPSKKTFKRSKKTSSPSKKTFKQSKKTSSPSKKTSFPSKKTFKRSKKTSSQSKKTSSPSKKTPSQSKKRKIKKQSSKIKKSKKEKSTQLKSKSNILLKYKSHLQDAYVIALNALVYKQPNFDAEQIFYLKSGSKALISKKLFSPYHDFGTFYKVFIKKPVKIVGYVSEIDVIPQYKKKKNKYQLNPKYQIIKKQLDKYGKFNLESLKEDKGTISAKNEGSSVGDRVSLTPRSNSNRYIGFSIGGRYNPQFFGSDKKYISVEDIDVLLGLKLSGKKLLASKVEMDINVNVAFPRVSFYYLDVLVGYPLLSGYKYTVYVMGGLKMDSSNPSSSAQVNSNKPDLGLVGSLSFVKPFKNKFFWRIDLKADYGFAKKNIHPSLLTSVQVAF